VTVRPFNTYGPRQSARAFIPTVISQALLHDRIQLGSLEPVRDLTFVKDTAEGFLRVGLCEQLVGQTVNLGVGHGEPVGTVAQLILKVLGKEGLPIERDAARVRPERSEVLRLISDNTVARQVCGWQPRYTLEQGLAETVQWIQRHLDRYRSGVYAV
jgi:nucleoside-diphosphate-sugar epimerase